MKKFAEIFKGSNDYNEKTVIGFISFAIMVIVMVIDVITGFCGYELPINDFVYNNSVQIQNIFIIIFFKKIDICF